MPTLAAEPILYLTRDDVRTLLPDVHEQLDIVEATYRAMSRGEVELPPKPGVHPRQDCFIHAMPAYLRDSDVSAIKWVSGYPPNPSRDLPYITGLIVLNDSETGLPLAIMDAAEITAARTAAASGVCIRAFAPEGWTSAAVLGCGEQGRFHLEVLRALNPDVEVRAFDPVAARAEALAPGGAADDPLAAVAGADIVVTAGPIIENATPTLAPSTLSERALVLPIDFDFYVQAETVRQAAAFSVDDDAQFRYYRDSQGFFQGWPDPPATAGDWLEARASGTIFEAEGQVVCCNLGVATLDAAFADAVVRRARDAGVGTSLER